MLSVTFRSAKATQFCILMSFCLVGVKSRAHNLAEGRLQNGTALNRNQMLTRLKAKERRHFGGDVRRSVGMEFCAGKTAVGEAKLKENLE